MDPTFERQAEAAHAVMAACERGQGAFEALGEPLSAFYADQMARGGVLAGQARAAMSAYADSFGFAGVAGYMRDVIENGAGGRGAHRRRPSDAARYLGECEAFSAVAGLAASALEAGCIDAGGELASLVREVMDSRDEALAAIAPLVEAER